MSRRRGGTPTASSQFDINDDVEEIIGEVRMLDQVSKAIGKELEEQNRFVAQMNNNYHNALNVIQNLMGNIKKLASTAGISPMTLTLIFVFGIIVFLWIYWKVWA